MFQEEGKWFLCYEEKKWFRRSRNFVVCGECTVWFFYPSFVRCPSWMESMFSEWWSSRVEKEKVGK
jgi:hypothetical protein